VFSDLPSTAELDPKLLMRLRHPSAAGEIAASPWPGTPSMPRRRTAVVMAV